MNECMYIRMHVYMYAYMNTGANTICTLLIKHTAPTSGGGLSHGHVLEAKNPFQGDVHPGLLHGLPHGGSRQRLPGIHRSPWTPLYVYTVRMYSVCMYVYMYVQ